MKKAGRWNYKELNMHKTVYCFLVIALALTACDSQRKSVQGESSDNTLTEEEKKNGWKLLFDGETFDGWRGLGRDTVPVEHWKIEDGAIRKLNNEAVAEQSGGTLPQGGDLMSIQGYDNYELSFEWKILKAGNSGLKYNVSEELSQENGSMYSALGFEYQLLDDEDSKYVGKLKSSQYTGSLYDMVPSEGAVKKPVGTYNQSRILIDGNHAEHWLNGKKVVTYEFGSKSLDSLYQASKFNKYAGFLDKKKGHIILQNHSDDAWFKNIKIREIPQ